LQNFINGTLEKLAVATDTPVDLEIWKLIICMPPVT